MGIGAWGMGERGKVLSAGWQLQTVIEYKVEHRNMVNNIRVTRCGVR